MKYLGSHPIVLFLVLNLFLLLIFLIFPINLFEGEIIVENGLSTFKEIRPISLSYFVGLGYEPTDLIGIKDFYLLPKGYLTAFLIIFCLPALIAYRVSIGKKNK